MPRWTYVLAGVLAALQVVDGMALSRPRVEWNRTQTWALIGWTEYLTVAQATFLATHYDLIGLGGNFGAPMEYADELGEAAAAKQLKEINPDLKVIIYRNSQVYISKALAAGRVFEQHPEWRLHNTTGQPVANFFDLTNPACRGWWLNSTVGAITDYVNGTAIDGVFVDGGGDYGFLTGGALPPGKAEALNASHSLMIAELSTQLAAIRPGMLGAIGNGAILDECGWNGTGTSLEPCVRNLPELAGVCAEHFGAFGDVNTSTGNYDGLGMEKWNAAMDQVQAAPGSKVAIYKAWPGPIGMYRNPNGSM